MCIASCICTLSPTATEVSLLLCVTGFNLRILPSSSAGFSEWQQFVDEDDEDESHDNVSGDDDDDEDEDLRTIFGDAQTKRTLQAQKCFLTRFL